MKAPVPATLADLEEVWRNLGELEDAARAKTLLEMLAAQLKVTPADQASRIIDEFLHSSRNARTLLPFCIGNAGCLTTAPTFRVWLMDQLARVNAEAAAAYADRIRPNVDKAAHKMHELSDDIMSAIKSYRDGDNSGSKRFT